jgi:hypothetical protein
VLPDGDPAAELDAIEPRVAATLGQVLSPSRKALRDAGEKGAPAADRVAPADPSPPVDGGMRDGWRRSSFFMPLHFGDYGGDAWIELRARKAGFAVVVFALLVRNDPSHADPRDVAAMLRSFRPRQAPSPER